MRGKFTFDLIGQSFTVEVPVCKDYFEIAIHFNGANCILSNSLNRV